jgi:hypothetical protein
MNRTMISRMIAALFFTRLGVVEGGGGGEGEPKVDVAVARTFLNDFVPADTVKTMKDEDVVKTYTQYETGIKKHGYAKPAEPPKEYKLQLPEGTTLTSKDVDAVVSFAKEKKLSVEAAQLILNTRHETLKGHGESLKATIEQRTKEWQKATNEDKEFGGDKLAASTKVANAVLDEFGDDEFRKVLTETGYHAHPAVRRFLAKVGIAMAEDKPGGGAGGGGEKKDAVAVLYDNTPK